MPYPINMPHCSNRNSGRQEETNRKAGIGDMLIIKPGYILSILFIFIFFIPSYSQSGHLFDSLDNVYSSNYLWKKYFEYRKKPGLIAGMISEISSIKNERTKDLAVIAIFNNLYGYPWAKKDDEIAMIDAVLDNSDDSAVVNLGKKIKDERINGLRNTKIIDIRLPDEKGDTIPLNDFRGKYVVIDLWATWCRPCVAAMKDIPALIKKYKVTFYSISYDKSFEAMKKFVEKNNYQWPIVYAGEKSREWNYFKVRAIPHFYMVDPQGIIVDETVQNLEQMIKRALAKD